MLNVSEIATSTEERVLTGVKAGQALVIDGMRNALSIADRVVPTQLSQRIEGQINGLPDASPVVTGAFGFAGKLLDAQREFVGEVVDMVQPAAKPAAKAPAVKTTAKKTAKKVTKTAKKVTAKKAA